MACVGAPAGSRETNASRTAFSVVSASARSRTASGSRRRGMSGLLDPLEADLAHLAGRDDAVAQVDGEPRLARRHLEQIDCDPVPEVLGERVADDRLRQTRRHLVVALEDQALHPAAEAGTDRP